MEDWFARVIGIAGVLLALLSLGLTWYLWWRAGARMRVTAFVRAETGAIHVEIASTGRIAVTVRELEIRDFFTMRTDQGGNTVPTSRWAHPITGRRVSTPSGDGLPAQLEPTASAFVDVPVAELLETAGTSPTVIVAAWAQRGDGTWSSSKPLQIR
jgi:hypothetical protein